MLLSWQPDAAELMQKTEFWEKSVICLTDLLPSFRKRIALL